MTQMQKNLFETMLAQAIINNIHICGRGTVRATGQQFYIVSSSDGVNAYHVMVDGQHLHCNCKAGQNGRYCSHRALTLATIMEAAKKAQPAPAAVVAASNETFRNAPVMSIYR